MRIFRFSYVLYAYFTLTYFYTRILLQRILYAYDTSPPGLDVFCRAHGDGQRGAPLAIVRRTPSHNSQCMSLSTPIQHTPQPCRTMNALDCQTFCKVLFAVCYTIFCTARRTVHCSQNFRRLVCHFPYTTYF